MISRLFGIFMGSSRTLYASGLSRNMFAHTFREWFVTHYVRTHFTRMFRPPFQRWRGYGRGALYSAFLFGNFFFALMVSKKKWTKDEMLPKLVALSLDTKTL